MQKPVDYCPFCCCDHVIDEHPRDDETEREYWERMDEVYDESVEG